MRLIHKIINEKNIMKTKLFLSLITIFIFLKFNIRNQSYLIK